MWSTSKNEVFGRFLANKGLLIHAWSALVNSANVVNEKGNGCSGKSGDEFPLVITDNVRVIEVFGGVGLWPESASEESMGVVGLEPTETEVEGFTVGLQVYTGKSQRPPEQFFRSFCNESIMRVNAD